MVVVAVTIEVPQALEIVQLSVKGVLAGAVTLTEVALVAGVVVKVAPLMDHV
jgi:hypothetical protein